MLRRLKLVETMINLLNCCEKGGEFALFYLMRVHSETPSTTVVLEIEEVIFINSTQSSFID